MTDKSPLQVSVPEEAVRHLARNVPKDFAAYCERLRQRQSRNFPSMRHREGQGIPYSLREVVRAAVEDLPEDFDAGDLCEELFDIAIRYEAMLVSVDYSISPGDIHKELLGLSKSLARAHSKLSNSVRDAIVLEQKGLLELDDLKLDRAAFDDAGSLAEKAAIASQYVARAEAELVYMREHFHYKSGLRTPGKPPVYSFAYAILALADLFERVNRKGHVASVSDVSNLRGKEKPDDSLYEGPFLRFVEVFFRRFNPEQIANHSGGGFANSVRKLAQARKKAPNLHLQLHGQATAQEVIYFMHGFDQIR